MYESYVVSSCPRLSGHRGHFVVVAINLELQHSKTEQDGMELKYQSRVCRLPTLAVKSQDSGLRGKTHQSSSIVHGLNMTLKICDK